MIIFKLSKCQSHVFGFASGPAGSALGGKLPKVERAVPKVNSLLKAEEQQVFH